VIFSMRQSVLNAVWGGLVPIARSIGRWSVDDDDLLRFMCSYPLSRALRSSRSRSAPWAGLTTAAIAHVFLVPEATMAQRIGRAKQLIKKLGADFCMPTAEHDEPLAAVLHAELDYAHHPVRISSAR
jgi:predicted RNA polymerase sigma factor